MNLTLQIKLLPTDEQAKSLLQTMKESNKACNHISEMACKNQLFNQFKVHYLVYHSLKNSTRLSAQVIVLCISKVIDANKLNQKKKRSFRSLGAITYDPRILSYKGMMASI